MALAAVPQFHVLAVDDSLIDRKLIERLLKTSSYQGTLHSVAHFPRFNLHHFHVSVTTVESGNKALEFLGLHHEPTNLSSRVQEIEVNLVITDYCMPGMTGFDLLKRIKESKSLKDIPVVIMSSENVPSRINRCLEEGAEEFLLKPVQLADMKKLRPHIMKGKTKEPPPSSPPPVSPTQEGTSNSNSENSNKRKAMEVGISNERTRPRFSNNSMRVL